MEKKKKLTDLPTFDLPIQDVIAEVKEKLNANNTIIVNAPPGAGKSTLLPLTLLKEDWLEGKKIIMLEPRRLAAKTIAQRMSSMIGEEVGNTVGYRIRFETRVNDTTIIEVVTEGILTRMLHADNELSDVKLIIFDEFHERSIHADVALALSREAQQILRPDLKIMIMSATLNMPELTALLNAPSVISKGRQYPVEIKHVDKQDQFLLPELAAQTIVNAVKENDGDVLAFFPGVGEISKCEEILKKQLRNFSIHPLYGQLPYNKQKRAIYPHPDGKRKVVLATSIAETSLTIEGIKIVVDTGFGRTSKYDPKSSLTRLETIQISRDSADQRAGRAGRLSAGVCYRMWSKTVDQRLQENRTPEVLEADLSSLVLDMTQWGIADINQLTWLTPPPSGAVSQALELLNEIGAIKEGKITEHGKEIHQLPCHPRIAHMLIKAEEEDLLPLATDLAALIEERDPLGRDAGIDINNRIEALRRFRTNQGNGGKFGRIDRIADSYRKIFDTEIDNSGFDPFETGVLIAHAYPERIAFARPGNNAQFQLANGRYAFASHRDDLAHEAWLAVAHLDARDGQGKIFLASPLNPKDLAPLVKRKEVIKWDTEDGGLIASLDMRIGTIVLQSTPLPEPDEEHLVDAIIDAIKIEGATLLDFNKEVTQWQNRILSLKKWNPQAGWPDMSTTTLLATCNTWLRPYLSKVKKPLDLKKLNLLEVLQYSLDHTKQTLFNTLAPSHITVPSGSKILLDYKSNGDAPILSVRLQEMFGLGKTPTVNQNKTTVLLHLLSPGFKPIQITSDLENFWNDTYFEVKKELKNRYPKHVWPEDPWNEPATNRAKKRK